MSVRTREEHPSDERAARWSERHPAIRHCNRGADHYHGLHEVDPDAMLVSLHHRVRHRRDKDFDGGGLEINPSLFKPIANGLFLVQRSKIRILDLHQANGPQTRNTSEIFFRDRSAAHDAAQSAVVENRASAKPMVDRLAY
jgi:hypothetical protein